MCVCAIGSNTRETPIHGTNQEGINDIMSDGYEVNDDILPAHDNKPIPKVDNY